MYCIYLENFADMKRYLHYKIIHNVVIKQKFNGKEVEFMKMGNNFDDANVKFLTKKNLLII